MKYVFIKWIGENVKPLKRAKALEGGRKMQEVVKVGLSLFASIELTIHVIFRFIISKYPGANWLI